MKEYLKNQIKRIILGHTVKLETTDDSIIFKLQKNSFFGNQYILIKHRETGKRISLLIKNSKAELYKYELEDM
ncbi:MAG: hypothetical protein PHY59_02235 [Methanobacterium sp.]|nr:hypothetical protein [Methanobacterium sp.]